MRNPFSNPFSRNNPAVGSGMASLPLNGDFSLAPAPPKPTGGLGGLGGMIIPDKDRREQIAQQLMQQSQQQAQQPPQFMPSGMQMAPAMAPQGAQSFQGGAWSQFAPQMSPQAQQLMQLFQRQGR